MLKQIFSKNNFEMNNINRIFMNNLCVHNYHNKISSFFLNSNGRRYTDIFFSSKMHFSEYSSFNRNKSRDGTNNKKSYNRNGNEFEGNTNDYPHEQNKCKKDCVKYIHLKYF